MGTDYKPSLQAGSLGARLRVGTSKSSGVLDWETWLERCPQSGGRELVPMRPTESAGLWVGRWRAGPSSSLAGGGCWALCSPELRALEWFLLKY